MFVRIVWREHAHKKQRRDTHNVCAPIVCENDIPGICQSQLGDMTRGLFD